MEGRPMEGDKKAAERWPRTFRDLMAKTRADVKRSRFVSSEDRRASIPDEEYIEEAQDELKSVIRALESVGDSSEKGDDIDFDEIQYAVKYLDYVLDSLNRVSGYEKQQKFLYKIDRDLAQLVREAHEEYKQWEREQSRHRAENISLADKADDLAKILKGIKI
jgi:hypothetical protein